MVSDSFAHELQSNVISRRGAFKGTALLAASLSQLWSNYCVAANVDRVKPVRDVRTATLIRALYSRWQLFEVLVDCWHNS
jgi:hypothetical protein